jgi:hypothetical protein
MTAVTKKNVKKYESYKYAFERLQEAIEREFFLESIVIAESIIADRLLSYMVERIQVLELSDKLPTPRISLGNLIQQWARLEQKVPYRDWEDLISEVDKWRGDRNECAHGLVKSNPGNSTKPVVEFLNTARDCALQGKKLARDVCDWTQRRKSQIRKEAQRQKFEHIE